MPKKYRKKAAVVEVLKTYHGQPMAELKEFLEKRLYMSSAYDDEVFDESIEGDFKVTPGDYIIKDDSGQITVSSTFNCDDNYELVIDSNEIYLIVTSYGFTIEQAEAMLSNSETRAILLTNLQSQNKFSPAVTVNQSFNVKGEADVGRIVNGITERMHEEILKGATKVY